jgi:hypothetical protein
MDLIQLYSEPFNFNTKKIKKKKDDIITQKKHTYLNINSIDRNTESSNVIDSIIYYLPNNPLKITRDSNEILIHIPNHTLSIDDKIIIENVVSTTVTQTFTLTFIENTLYFTAEKNTPGFDLIKYIISTYNRDLYISISGVVGEDSITKELNGLYLFNFIPINLINKKHNVLFSTTINNRLNTIFINIDIPPTNNTLSGTKNLTITLLNIGGIPINLINANYPLTDDRLQGFQDILAVSKDYVSIRVNYTATNSIISGGNNIVVSHIINQLSSFPTPDYYELILKKNFRRVAELKVISSEIPFTTKNVTKNNNTFYWKNVTDGSYVNSVIIPDGLYTSTSLLELLVSLTNKVVVNNSSNKYHYFTFTITNLTYTLFTNVVTTLYQPLATDAVISTSEALTKYMYINFDYHNLRDGDTIVIKNALSFNGIPSEVINSTYTVIVVNQNQIKVTLPNYNQDPNTVQINNSGGNTVQIIIPINCRLIASDFNILNTIGLKESINYATSFKSYKPILTCLFPHIELRCILPNVNNENYNFIDSEPILTKIRMKGNIGEFIYDKHSNMSLIFNPPINDLSTITFQFVYPDGSTVDFNNVEHSFTLQITELFDVHLDTAIEIVN